MPVGVILDALAVLLGGLAGAAIRGRISSSFRENLNITFGCCAMTIGIGGILMMETMPAVIFSVVVGTAIGLAVHLGAGINRCAGWVQAAASRLSGGEKSPEASDGLLTAVVLFCASGTGIYGALVAGMTGDHSVLIAKSILDFFTAAIFACSLGRMICLICVPQFLIYLVLYLLAGPISRMSTPEMIHDFQAAGGVVMLATGFRIAKIKAFPVADMLPAMALVMPVSWAWTAYLQPLIVRLGGG